jgi:hypothetical protein
LYSRVYFAVPYQFLFQFPLHFVTLDTERGCSHLGRSHFLSSISTNGWAQVRGVYAGQDIVADVLQQQNWHYRYSPPPHKTQIDVFFMAKRHAYKSLESEMTVSFVNSRTTGVVTIEFDACTHPLYSPPPANSVTDKNGALV